jgi:hypothetical protein
LTCFPVKRHLNRDEYREESFLPKIHFIATRWSDFRRRQDLVTDFIEHLQVFF